MALSRYHVQPYPGSGASTALGWACRWVVTDGRLPGRSAGATYNHVGGAIAGFTELEDAEAFARLKEAEHQRSLFNIKLARIMGP